MRYYATVGEHTYEISIDHHGRIMIDGTELAVDMKAVAGRQLYSLLVENISHEIVLDPDSDQRALYGIMVEGQRYIVKVQDERSRRLALADRNLKPPDGELLIKAPIPGLVVKVMVAPGQQVAEGDPLLILEAMKMENELRAPRDGVIHELRIEPRMQVAVGQIMLSLR
jgi:biotin carboxyl carrier protein